MKLSRSGPLRGRLKVPGDKSISHRALILGAMARGQHVIEGLSTATDVGRTRECLLALGCFIETMPDGRTIVLPGKFRREAEFDAGNSGTTARLLAGFAASLGIACTIDGDASLRRRPMKRVADPLAQMGAHIVTSEGGTLPLRIRPSSLTGIRYELPVPSAQVKSAILIAGLNAAGETTIIEPVATRDHTERMLSALGASIEVSECRITVRGGGRLEGARIRVPGDPSSAAFFAVAAACIPGSDIELILTGVNPRRAGAFDLLTEMGGVIERNIEEVLTGEPVADLTVRHAALRGVTVSDPARIASMIDEIPVLAVAATQAEGETVFRGVGELRHKESDRLAALVDNLRALGADIEVSGDDIAIRGPRALRAAQVSSYGDHRVAMAMAVAALIATGETVIDDTSVIDISYPGFFDDLRTLIH